MRSAVRPGAPDVPQPARRRLRLPTVHGQRTRVGATIPTWREGTCSGHSPRRRRETGSCLGRSPWSGSTSAGTLACPTMTSGGPRARRWSGSTSHSAGSLTSEAGKMTPLRGDFIHEPTETLIEVDESQHFTSFRLVTLDLYPEDWPLGYDLQAPLQDLARAVGRLLPDQGGPWLCASAAGRSSAPTTTRSATSPRRRWDGLRLSASRLLSAIRPMPIVATARNCSTPWPDALTATGWIHTTPTRARLGIDCSTGRDWPDHMRVPRPPGRRPRESGGSAPLTTQRASIPSSLRRLVICSAGTRRRRARSSSSWRDPASSALSDTRAQRAKSSALSWGSAAGARAAGGRVGGRG